MLTAPAFIRNQAGIKDRADGCTIQGELLSRAIDPHAKLYFAIRGGVGGMEGKPLTRPIAQTRNDLNDAGTGFTGEKGCVKLGTVVIGGQARSALPVWRISKQGGRSKVGMVFLPAGHKGLFKPGPDAFTPGHTQTVGCQREQAFGIGCAQPLKFIWQDMGKGVAERFVWQTRNAQRQIAGRHKATVCKI